MIANGEAIGTTPVSQSFTFYGDRTIRIIKEGYETKDVVAADQGPLVRQLLTEFFTENLIPYTFRDEVEFNYKLDPPRPADPNDVLDRAEAIRAEGRPAQRRGAGRSAASSGSESGPAELDATASDRPRTGQMVPAPGPSTAASAGRPRGTIATGRSDRP